ncbi:MAG: polyprenol monophosphomannose synthase [Calditrichia bacterium]
MKRALVITPTYNECENVPKLLEQVFALDTSAYDTTIDVLIVDDNSPDGTADIIKDMQKTNERLFLLEREGKLGLGTAYIAGFRYAIEHGYDYVMEMDADLSHDPIILPVFLKEIQEVDLVIGSRYLIGVNVINWPLSRLILSMFASKYTRIITGLPLTDCTSGFKCFRREVLEAIPLEEIRSNGYSFQIEMHFKAWKRKFKIREVSIVFTDREVGSSKMSRSIVYEAAFMVWKLKLRSLMGKY